MKKVQKQPGGATEIMYKDAKIMAPTIHIQQALEILSKGEETRLRVMQSVNESLRKNFKKVMSGRATHEMAMNVGQDIAIWYANKLLMQEKNV